MPPLDIFSVPVPSNLNVIRGDIARIAFGGPGQEMSLIVNQYTIAYQQNVALQRDLSDPDAVVIVKRFPNPGQITIASLIGSMQELRAFANYYGDVCETAGRNITWIVTAAAADCDTEELRLITHHCTLVNTDISGNAQNPFVGGALTLQFLALEMQ